MNKSSLDISCHSGLTKQKHHHSKLRVLKGDSRVCKPRAIPSLHKKLLEEKVKGPEMEKEGRVHGGALLEILAKSEKELGLGLELNGRVYNHDPSETRLGEMKLPEGRVHGGNLLALIGGIEGLSN